MSSTNDQQNAPVMRSVDYISDAIRTESRDWDAIVARFHDVGIIRLLHGAMGLQTEVGEFMDALKKFIFYGKEVDEINLAEEVGDLFWYLAIICSELDLEFETIMAANLAKLRVRYPQKFSETEAVTRDLGAERAALENGK